MRGALRAVAYGWETVYTLHRELYSSQWFAAEELARADLAAHQDLLTVVNQSGSVMAADRRRRAVTGEVTRSGRGALCTQSRPNERRTTERRKRTYAGVFASPGVARTDARAGLRDERLTSARLLDSHTSVSDRPHRPK